MVKPIVLTILLLVLAQTIRYHYLYSSERDVALKETFPESYTMGESTREFKHDASVNITSARLIAETPSELTFELIYDYSGAKDEERLWFATYKLKDGRREPMTGHKPGRIKPGNGNKTKTYITLIDRSSDEGESDAIVFQAYPSRGSAFHSQVFEFEKSWCKTRATIWQPFSKCN